jgi:hypothetical protein
MMVIFSSVKRQTKGAQRVRDIMKKTGTIVYPNSQYHSIAPDILIPLF